MDALSRIPRIAAALAPLAIVLSAQPARADAVAVAGSVRGAVSVKAGDGGFRPLRLFQRLNAGDVVRVEAGGEAMLTMIGKGDRYRVGGGVTATVTADGIDGAEKVAALGGRAPQVLRGMVAYRTDGLMGRPGLSPSPLQRTPVAGYLVRADGAPAVLSWDPDPGVASWGFTLFDRYGNVVFHTRTPGTSATYPAELGAPLPKTPYLWRLVPYNERGRLMINKASRWGAATFLTQDDATAFEAGMADLQKQVTPEDTSALIAQIDLCREYGVFARVFDLLGDSALMATQNGVRAVKPGVEEMREQVYRELGPVAVMFAHPLPADDASETKGR